MTFRLHLVSTLCFLLVIPNICAVYNETLNIAFFLHIHNHGEGRRFGGSFFNAINEVNQEYPNLNFNYTFGDTLGHSWESLRKVAELYCANQTSALVGPDGYCASSALAAKAFDLPYIAYTCHEALPEDEHGVYTFVSTEPSPNKVSKFIISVFSQFKWSTFTIISSYELKWRDTAKRLETLAIDNKIHISNITFSSESEFYHGNDNGFEEVLSDTIDQTRIYVFLGDYQALIKFARDMYNKLGEKRKDYVLIGVDDRQPVTNQDEYFLYNPIELNHIEPGPEHLEPFRNVIILTLRATKNKNWDQFLNETYQRNKQHPMNYPSPPSFVKEKIPNIPIQVAYLYDAVKIYAKALNETMASGGNIRNATEVISKLRGRSYKSIQGFNVFIDSHGQNEGNYTLMSIHVDSNGRAVHRMDPVAEFARSYNYSNPMMLPSKVYEISWLSGAPPPSQPACGFTGEKCNTNWELVVIGSVIAAAVIVLLALGLVGMRVSKYLRYEKKLASLLWKIDKEDLRFVDSVNDFYLPGRQRKKVYSPWRFLLPSDNESDKKSSRNEKENNIHVASYRGTIVFIKQVSRRNLDINRDMKKQLQLRKELSHDNINRFIGACIELPEVYIVTQYCQRGSLQDILRNEDSALDDMFVSSLVADLIKGMIFIHDSNIISHGNLRSSNCLVDSRWVLQISDFGLPSVFNPVDTSKNEEYYNKLLIKSPELLRNPNYHSRGTQKGDVYAFAFILYEMHIKKGPWGNLTMNPQEILNLVKEPNTVPPFRPSLEEMTAEEYISSCINECWSEDPDYRPDFKTIRTRLKQMHQGLKANIFDNMLAMMEKYANNLEALVADRTEQLSVEKKMTENLLLRMLPRPVAEQLKRGNPVVPEQYQCVSIYFSDIVGFTALSAASTPMEVIDMLNDLYSLFDSIIEHYDVYKVETIGDAYVVVSGLPIRNMDNHAGEIASMSLHLLTGLNTFRLRHQPDSSVRIRIGIHSGPCCAGVVGHKMPRYCLFGDTVNTASRMESTGEAMKIHCSGELKGILDKLGGYNLEERGYIAMKGKGEKLTYFLVGEDKNHRIRRISVDQLASSASDTPRQSVTKKPHLNGSAVPEYCETVTPFQLNKPKQTEVDINSVIINNIPTATGGFPSRDIVRRHTVNGGSSSHESSPCDSQCSECEHTTFTIEDPNELKCLLKSLPAKKCQKVRKHNSDIPISRTTGDNNKLNGSIPDTMV